MSLWLADGGWEVPRCKGASIGACRTCLEARGIDDAALVVGINRRTLDDLRTWAEEATKVLVY